MKKNVLIVDDEKSILDFFSAVLKKENYIPLVAQTPAECLKILKTNEVRAMFLDLNLKDVSGIDLCKNIRATNTISWIAAITGYSSIFEVDQCREAGFDDYFLKPLDLTLIIRETNSAFERMERWFKRD